MEDHATRKIAKHYLAIPKCVKEDGISDFLKKFYAAVLWKIRDYHQMEEMRN